jgi:hypothetical protein
MCWLVSGWRLSMMVTCNDTTAVMFDSVGVRYSSFWGLSVGLWGAVECRGGTRLPTRGEQKKVLHVTNEARTSTDGRVCV